MGKIVADLRNLIVTAKPVRRGTVQALGAAFVTVATPDGLKDFKAPVIASYRVGDEVLIQGEVLVGRVASEAGIPSYSV